MYIYTARAEHTAARGDPAGASEGTRTRASPHARARGAGRGARGRFTHRRRRRRRCQGRGEPGPQGRPRCRSAGPASACVHVRGTPRPRRRGCSAGSPRARSPCSGEARPLPAQAQRQTPVNRRMLWRARGGGQAMAREGAADPRRTGVRPPRESSQPRARLALAPAHMHGMWPGTVCVHASAAHVHCAISSAPCHRPAEVLTASHRHRSAAALWRLLSAQPRSEAAQSNFDSQACQL